MLFNRYTVIGDLMYRGQTMFTDSNIYSIIHFDYPVPNFIILLSKILTVEIKNQKNK